MENKLNKIIVVSNDSYVKDFYINDIKVCSSVGKNSKQYFEIPSGNYRVYAFSKHSNNKSNVEILSLNENKKIILTQGFINPKLKVSTLSDEEITQYNDNNFIKLDNFNYINTVNIQKSSSINKNVNPLITAVTILFGLFLFFLGINFIIDGNKKINKDNRYSYSIESRGLNDYGIYTIKGTVTNNTKKLVDGLQIEFKCYNSLNNYVETIKGYIENLNAGETWSYVASSSNNSTEISTCEFYKIVPFTKIMEIH